MKIPAKSWKAVHLPFRVVNPQHVAITVAFKRQGGQATYSMTRNGHIRMEIWNCTEGIMHIAPRAVMVHVWGENIGIRKLGEKWKNANVVDVSSLEEMKENPAIVIREYIMEKFSAVGDLSSHPITPAMRRMEVDDIKVEFRRPGGEGFRTPYQYDKIIDRSRVNEQLEEYKRMGYIKEVSHSEDIMMSPLLPIRKPDGRIRFVNDYRALNECFSKKGIQQVDVQRTLRGLNPEWKYFCKIDLKDAFFSVPISPGLARCFGFQWECRRFVWTRLPQGWVWSSIFFHEIVAEVLRECEALQYADDILVGADIPQNLLVKIEKNIP